MTIKLIFGDENLWRRPAFWSQAQVDKIIAQMINRSNLKEIDCTFEHFRDVLVGPRNRDGKINPHYPLENDFLELEKVGQVTLFFQRKSDATFGGEYRDLIKEVLAPETYKEWEYLVDALATQIKGRKPKDLYRVWGYEIRKNPPGSGNSENPKRVP